MATQVMQVAGTAAVRPGHCHRSRARVDRSLIAALHRLALVVALVLGLCGMIVLASSAAAGTTPPEGPAPGLVQ